MATDIQARDTGSSGVVIGLVALVLVLAVTGFIFYNSGTPLPVGPSSTTVVNNPAPASPPSNTTVVTPPSINISPSAPSAAPASGTSDAGASGDSSSGGQ